MRTAGKHIPHWLGVWYRDIMASDVYKVKDASTSPSVFDFSGPGLVSVSWYHALKTIVQIRIKKKKTSHTMCLSPLHQRHFQAWKKMMKTLVISVYFQRWKKPLDRRPYSHTICCNLHDGLCCSLLPCPGAVEYPEAKVYSIWQRVNRQTNRSCIINGSVTIPLFKKRNTSFIA